MRFARPSAFGSGTPRSSTLANPRKGTHHEPSIIRTLSRRKYPNLERALALSSYPRGALEAGVGWRSKDLIEAGLVWSEARCLDAFRNRLGNPQCICNDGQRRIDGSDRGKEARIGDVEVFYFMGFAVEVEDTICSFKHGLKRG